MLTTSLQLGTGISLAAAAAAIAIWQVMHTPIRTIPMDTTLWPYRWPHEPPDRPLSVPEAHQAMRQHRDCLREECPRKNAAYLALVEVGHLTPDAGRAQ